MSDWYADVRKAGRGQNMYGILRSLNKECGLMLVVMELENFKQGINDLIYFKTAS